MKKHLPFIISSCLLILLVGIESAAILRTNLGMFVYPLDDAYIHLSIAENIGQGTYGINQGEFASAASSILWPFLLAPFMYFAFGTYVPLLLNLLFGVATLFILERIFNSYFENIPQKNLFLTTLLIFFVFAAGMVGLIMTGMEHSLQLFSVVFILYSIVKELQGDYDARMMISSIVLASVVRYENLAVCLFAIAFVIVRGRKKEAMISLVSVLSLLSAFSLFLFFNEGSLLPSSVMAKIGSMRTSMMPFAKLFETSGSSFGKLYGLVALVLVIVAIIRRHDFTTVVLGSGAAFITLLHLAYGKTQYFGGLFEEFGYYFRYEMYLWTFLLMALIIVSRNVLATIFQYSKTVFFLLLLIVVLGVCGRNTMMLFSIPTASSNIFEQHYHVHKFVTEFYKKPVAANDIGYVSYQNSSAVLDLWGLTSKNILSLRKNNPGKSEWLDSLVTEKNISLVIIYDVWFPKRPPLWKKVAELTLTRPNITASENVVSYYAVNNAEEIIQKLRAFRDEMPLKEMLRIIQ